MKNEVFDEKYKNLNSSQKEAVDTIEGPVMVIAGPGTGKTTILTLRIANILLKTDTPPSGILALTFTEAGVKAIRLKCREILGSRADEIRIHTFHSFASSVISEFGDHFPHLAKSIQITDIESEQFIREILKDKKFAKLRPLGDPDYYIGKIISTVSESKREAWTSEMIKDFALNEEERIKNDQDSISTRGKNKGELKADALKNIEKCQKTVLFSEVYRKYEDKKRAENKIDFDDLIFEFLLALKKDELLLRLLQEKFLYILVDEHQDTNDSQNLIISYLADFFDTPNVFVVGDEKQAIYRFQGASVQNFLKFQNLWKSMKIIPLKENYRSHQSILDATFSMIENNYEEGQYVDLRVKLKSENHQLTKPIDYIECGNDDAEDNFLITKLKEIISLGDSKIAVIVRRNREVERVISLCEKNNIPVSAERGADIFSHPLGILYFNLLEFISDPSKTEGLSEIFACGLLGDDFDRQIECLKFIKSGQIEEIFKKIPQIEFIIKEETKLGPIDYLIFVAEISGLANRFLDNPLSSEVWRTIINLAKELAQSNKIESPKELINFLLSYKKTAERKSVKIGVGEISAQVSVLTAHSSKGLEYDFVFLPYANEENWVIRNKSNHFILPSQKDDKDDIKDLRRLFYVAITRAKKHAIIISSLKDFMGKSLMPLRFINELDSNHISKISIPEEDSKQFDISIKNLEEKRKKEIIQYSKRIISEKGLSVTALNHFLTCPSEFLYKSILKIPEAPNAISEKGIVMHKALSLVWKQEEKNQEEIERTIKNTISEYFKKSLLAVFEKETLKEELFNIAQVVAKSLCQYFNQKGEVSTESWVNKTLEIKADKEKIGINLHGQLDVILEKEKEVWVYDYKTKAPMSENEIKGNTKDSDGNYFRQLVFYKILLNENTKYKNKKIFPALIFLKPNKNGDCKITNLDILSSDEKRVYDEIENLITNVWSGKFLEEYCGDSSCKYCALKKISF